MSQVRSPYHWLSALDGWRKTRKARNITTLVLVVLGPLLALLTFLAIGPLELGASSRAIRVILLLDLIYVLFVAVLVLAQIMRLVAARRHKSAGSKLHLRLIGAFAVLAMVPTVIVAVFALLSLNVGLEGWFSNRVHDAIGNSLKAAQAYQFQQSEDLIEDASALAKIIDRSRQKNFFMDDGALRQTLAQGQLSVQRGLKEAYVVDGVGEIVVRGERSYEFDFESPSQTALQRADAESIHVIEDWENNEFRALVPLKAFVDRYLYISREVDGDLLNLLDDTQQTATLYQQLENARGRLLFEFGLLYLGFAVILVLAAMWAGMWFAERLSRPVGRLMVAAQRVGAGNLNVRVFEEQGDDEIGQLSRYFNQMTSQLRGQRETLLENTEQIESRRRLFDSVLSSVTSGVVGLDGEGQVTFVNTSARRLLDWRDDQETCALVVAVPEFGPLFRELSDSGSAFVQGEIKVTRQGRLENLLVRMSQRKSEGGALEGYVVAFDDVTDLVSAQRMAAWGDVARRIAHEIKNPLTPIQLSAERIKRKFAPKLGEENSDQLQNMTDVIVRQTNDLRRIVDEFSKFARMPEPDRQEQDLGQLVRESVLLQQAGQPDVKIAMQLEEAEMPVSVDATMIGQALTNLIKNAGEATHAKHDSDDRPEGYVPEVRVRVQSDGCGYLILIEDNGIGLPADRARLFEPYVTTRDEGTGLGLPIVKKIIEEHGGGLSLEDASIFEGCSHRGAMAVVQIPAIHPDGTAQRHTIKAGLT